MQIRTALLGWHNRKKTFNMRACLNKLMRFYLLRYSEKGFSCFLSIDFFHFKKFDEGVLFLLFSIFIMKKNRTQMLDLFIWEPVLRSCNVILVGYCLFICLFGITVIIVT